MTVVWHVDDLKTLYVDADAVTEIVMWMDKQYLDVTITQGKKHN